MTIDPTSMDVEVVDATKLRRAAEEAAWLIERDYRTDAVVDFVAAERELSDREHGLLVWSARVRAGYKHHIARELDPEDVAKRPLRIDADNVLSTIAAAVRGDLLLESPAGVLCDPSWGRDARRDLSQSLGRALELTVAALKMVKPSAVRWVFDQAAPHAEALTKAVEALPKSKRTRHEAKPTADVFTELAGGIVASSEPAVLDDCSAWLNLVALAVEPLEVRPLSLG